MLPTTGCISKPARLRRLNIISAKPIVFFKVKDDIELMPVGIQLENWGELFTPTMRNAENAWLLAKMQTNCAGQSLHDVGFHQLYTHQICAMVSIALFSEEVFNPLTHPVSDIPFQEHPVFKLLRPHVVKTAEFQQTTITAITIRLPNSFRQRALSTDNRAFIISASSMI